ncbi:MAG TPA: hypothetical protein VI412_05755, partial [Tabrizicola sp.]
LCWRYLDEPARRLLVEITWWRDNAHRLPWLPPSGDGSRYRRMMRYIHPDEADTEIVAEKPHVETRWAPSITPELSALFARATPEIADPRPRIPSAPLAGRPQVDWRFLDLDDGLPGELPEWAKKMLRRFPGHIPEDMIHRYRWSRPILPPVKPPQRAPNEPARDPDDFLEPDEDDDDAWIDPDDDEILNI